MINKAIRQLLPNQGWRMANPAPSNADEFAARFEIQTGFDDNQDAIFSSDPNDFGITWDEIQTEITRAEAEDVSLEYARDRAAAYPSLGDQLDMLWHAIDEGTLDKTSDFYTTLKTVKDDNPKPSE